MPPFSVTRLSHDVPNDQGTLTRDTFRRILDRARRLSVCALAVPLLLAASATSLATPAASAGPLSRENASIVGVTATAGIIDAQPIFMATSRVTPPDGNLEYLGTAIAKAMPVVSESRVVASSRSNRDNLHPFLAQAIEPARRSQVATGVPASVTLAQAILESDWGRSGLSTNGKNYFGIKASSKPGTAGVVYMNTWEVINGKNITVKAPFRKYLSMEDSFVDHGKFFAENARYAKAMAVKTDARAFAKAVHAAGYATDPAYSTKLIRLMEKYDLFQYDQK